jgi:hypothetical protein
MKVYWRYIKELAMKQSPAAPSIDLKEVEQAAYASKWQDGLIDLFAGVGVLGIGISWLSEFMVFSACLPALLIPLWAGVRKRITAPRAGSVVFTKKRMAKERRGLWGLALLGVLGCLWGGVAVVIMRTVPNHGGEITGLLVAALPNTLLGIGAAAVGFLFGIQRFLAYAVVLFVCGQIGAFLHLDPGYLFLPGGLVMVVVGIIMLNRFLHQNPASELEASA